MAKLTLVVASLLVAACAASIPVRGVNLGGWLVMEPWILPKLFDTANEGVPLAQDGTMQVVDEYTWHNTSLVGDHNRTQLLIDHWRTWVTQDHLVTLHKAGITHLRVPVGYWYWNTIDNESFATGRDTFPIALGLLKQMINEWASPLGLKVLLDMHTAPGSQNGFDNSGTRGDIHLLSQPDGSSDTANMARWEETVAELARWAVAELDANALWGIEVLNEPFGAWGKMYDAIFDVINPKGYQMVRNASQSLNVIFQAGFIPLNEQRIYNAPDYQGVWFDDHYYQCFGGDDNERAWNDTAQVGWDHHLSQSCLHKYDNVTGNVPSFVGEWSLAVTDCAKYLAGGINGGCNMTADPSCVYSGTPDRSGHPEICKYYTKPAAEMPDDYKAFLLQFARRHMDGFEQSGNGWFFWNFRTQDGHAPAWDFLLGLQEGYIDADVSNRPVACQ